MIKTTKRKSELVIGNAIDEYAIYIIQNKVNVREKDDAFEK